MAPRHPTPSATHRGVRQRRWSPPHSRPAVQPPAAEQTHPVTQAYRLEGKGWRRREWGRSQRRVPALSRPWGGGDVSRVKGGRSRSCRCRRRCPATAARGGGWAGWPADEEAVSPLRRLRRGGGARSAAGTAATSTGGVPPRCPRRATATVGRRRRERYRQARRRSRSRGTGDVHDVLPRDGRDGGCGGGGGVGGSGRCGGRRRRTTVRAFGWCSAAVEGGGGGKDGGHERRGAASRPKLRRLKTKQRIHAHGHSTAAATNGAREAVGSSTPHNR